MGDALFAATELVSSSQTEFISPGLLHVDGLRRAGRAGPCRWPGPKLRAIVLVGDGAFQMTAWSFRRSSRHSFRPHRDRAGQ